MCRLVALTATNVSNSEVAKILQLAMIASQASDSQNKDGWGVSSSWGNYMKNSGSFLASGQEWIDHVVNSRTRYTPALAHLRNSSAGTSVTVKEAQPFVFESNDGISFVGMHNGRMDGSYSGWRSWQTGDANSDSWRVFSRLNQMMLDKNQRTVNADLITEWLNAYDDSSAYVFVIASGSDIYIVRNNLRDLHCMRCGNGFLITTSADAARFVRNSASLHSISTVFPDKDPSAFIQDRLYHIRAGSHEIGFEELELQMKKGSRVWNNNSNFRNSYGYYDQQNYGKTGTQDAATTAAQTGQTAQEEDQVEVDRIELGNGAILLRPRNSGSVRHVEVTDDETRFSDDIIIEDDDESAAWQKLFDVGQHVLGDDRIDEIIRKCSDSCGDDISPQELLRHIESHRRRDRAEAISQIKSLMNPIRDTMLAMYIDMYTLGLFDSSQTISSSFVIVSDLKDIPDEQIFNFLNELKARPEDHPTDKVAHMILNKWNHAVPSGREQSVIQQYFGNNLPITVEANLALGIIDVLPVLSA